jgi:CRISPR-associated protein Cmr3
MSSSAPVAQWPVLAQDRRAKAVGGFWLTQHGWEDHLAGRLPATSELVATADLWQFDARVGVGLDATTGRADDGKLFTTQAVAFRRGVGFLAAVRGAELPNSGMLRFGGDGRSAYMTAVPHLVRETDWAGIAGSRRCRIVLTTPGLFSQGWQLPGLDSDHRLDWGGITGRLVSAAVARAEVVSGWDLATRQPKSALRAAPSGSTYWIDDLVATPEQLRKLAEQGLWNESNHNPARRAEGFNRFAFATY